MLNGASSKVLEEETRKLEAFESVLFKVSLAGGWLIYICLDICSGLLWFKVGEGVTWLACIHFLAWASSLNFSFFI